MQIFYRLVTSGMTSQEVQMFATGKLRNESNRIFCDLAGKTICFTFQDTNKLWSDFIHAAILHRNSTVARRVTNVTSEHHGDP